jgi:hypothetical protein
MNLSAPVELLQRSFAESLGSEQQPVLPFLQVPFQFDPTRDENFLRERVELYASGIQARQRAALVNAYPVLLAEIGDDRFDALSSAYAQAHPSQSGDLNRFGMSLPAFIERYEEQPRLRYCADLARLEWALHVAYFATDIAPLEQQAWLAMRSDELLEARLAVHPACELIYSPYAIGEIWKARHQSGSSVPANVDVPTCALVVRPRWQPEVLVQSVSAHAAFGALRRGATLNEALDAAFAIDAAFDFSSQWRVWISTCAITGVVDRL